jgi:hypothetical protein
MRNSERPAGEFLVNSRLEKRFGNADIDVEDEAFRLLKDLRRALGSYSLISKIEVSLAVDLESGADAEKEAS